MYVYMWVSSVWLQSTRQIVKILVTT